VKITNYLPGSEGSILALFELVFGREMSKSYWQWRFADNPAGKFMIKLMWEGEQLIGHYAVSPVVLNVEGQAYPTALSMTTMTHPDFIGKGIFRELAAALYDELYSSGKIKAIWGFPNSNSHYGFIKNLQWQNIGVVNTLIISNKLGAIPDSAINYVDEFNKDHLKLINLTLENYPVSIHRDLDYLNWRYVANPSNQYKIMELRDNELSALIVYKEYKHNSAKEIEINVMEIFCKPDYDLMQRMFKNIFYEYQGRTNKISLWLSLWDPRYILLEKMGFIMSGKNTFLSYHSKDTTNDKLSNLKNWYYSFGDSDVY